MNVRPFQLLSRSRAQALAGKASAALEQWARNWCALPDHAVSCRSAGELADAFGSRAPAQRRMLADGSHAWSVASAGLQRLLEQNIFGLPQLDAASDRHLSSSLGADVAAQALESLLQTLIEALCGQSSLPAGAEEPPAHMLRHGSGAVACSIALGDAQLRILVPLAPAAAPRPATGQGAPLVPLRQALAGVAVPLQVELCRTELTLGYLRTLAVGDVLALPAALDHPLRVAGPGDRKICDAHLGAVDGHRAVELIRGTQHD